MSLLFGAILLFWNLGGRGLNDPDEGRYASVALRMLDTGDWMHPVFMGRPHLTKPPLTYWAMAVSFRLFGANEWAARLPAALAAFGVLLLTASLAYRWYGPPAARNAVLLLATAPLFFGIARLADPNMLLTFWILLAFWAWETFRRTGSRWSQGLFYIALGLGFFTKGPVGPVLTLFGVAAFNRWGDPELPKRRIGSWLGVLCAAMLGLWWFVALVAENRELLRYWIGHELVARVASPALKRNEPFWFFFVILPAGFLPWLPLLASLTRQRQRAPWPWPVRPLLIWVAAALTLFTLSRSKLPTYILPLLPLLALLASAALERLSLDSRTPWRGQRFFILALSGGAVIAWVVLCQHPFPQALLLHPTFFLCVAGIALAGWRLLRTVDWVPWAAALAAFSYVGLVDIGMPHLEARNEKLTSSRLLKTLRAADYSREDQIYFTHMQASLYFYLRPMQDPVRWETADPQSKEPRHIAYTRMLRAHLKTLPPNGRRILITSDDLYDQSRSAGETWDRFREITRDSRFVALRML